MPNSCFSYHDTAPIAIYPLSLHDALPICWVAVGGRAWASAGDGGGEGVDHVSQGLLAADIAGEDHVRHAHDLLGGFPGGEQRSEEHTSELQSRGHLVCRLLLEKKNGCRTT